ncbi:MAG: hypothetical protein R3E79_25620 [Caldilineaceae bacterium]
MIDPRGDTIQHIDCEITLSIADSLGSFQGKAANKDGQPPKELMTLYTL